MVFNATFIPVILWLSVSLLEETEISGGKPQTCCKSLKNLTTYYFIKHTSLWAGFELTALVVIYTVNPLDIYVSQMVTDIILIW